MKIRFPVLFLFAVRLVSAAPECCTDGDLFGSGATGGEIVALNELQIRNLGLQTEPANESRFEVALFALGRIEAIPNKQAAVSSRIPGRVVSLSVNPGENVEAGQELLRIESRQPGNPPPVITLTAPIAGTVCEMDVRTGDPVEPDRRLMDVTDLHELVAVAKVFEHQAGLLTPGMQARIRVPAFPKDVFSGELVRLGTEVNRESGTIDAVFRIANPELRLRPGMRAEFSILTSVRESVLSVPRESVLGDGGNLFVYVADYEKPGVFRRVPVATGERNDRRVEIVAGLFPGDEVVTTGGYALQFAGGGSATLKEAMDAAHGHSHGPNGEELEAHAEHHGPDHEHGDEPEGSAVFPFPLAAGVAGVALVVGILIGRVSRRHA